MKRKSIRALAIMVAILPLFFACCNDDELVASVTFNETGSDLG